jgi:hypothetical protein
VRNLHLSALLVAEGLVTREELDSLRSELGDGASLEDALVERGVVDRRTLDRLMSLAQTPPPQEGTVTIGTPTDHTATIWELEAPDIEALEAQAQEDDEVSMDAVTGRFDGLKPLVSKTTKWDKEVEDSQLKGRTTRWEIPVPLPEDNPTGDWAVPQPGPGVSLPDAVERPQPGLLDTTSIEEAGFETQIEESDPEPN